MDYQRLLSVCSTMYHACSAAPYLRIGQLISNFMKKMEIKKKDPFYMTDDEFDAEFKKYVDSIVENGVVS